MRIRRYALIVLFIAAVAAISSTLSSGAKEVHLWKSLPHSVTIHSPKKFLLFAPPQQLVVFRQERPTPTGPNPPVMVIHPTVMLDKEKAFLTAVVNHEEATFLNAVNLLNVQEQSASQTSNGSTSQTTSSTPTQEPYAPSPSGADLPAIFSCIIQHESSGDPTAMNPSGAAGLFQDMPGTWGDYDGYSSAADAPVSVQYAFNEQLYASRGLEPWTGDPCVG